MLVGERNQNCNLQEQQHQDLELEPCVHSDNREAIQLADSKSYFPSNIYFSLAFLLCVCSYHHIFLNFDLRSFGRTRE